MLGACPTPSGLILGSFSFPRVRFATLGFVVEPLRGSRRRWRLLRFCGAWRWTGRVGESLGSLPPRRDNDRNSRIPPRQSFWTSTLKGSYNTAQGRGCAPWENETPRPQP